MANYVLTSRSRISDACQREESVACHVDNGLLVGRTLIVYLKFVVFSERIHHSHRQFTREAFFVVSRNVAEHKCVVVDLLCVPYASVETSRATVQVVRTIVNCEAIFLAIECKFTMANTIAIATYQSAEERFG